MKRIAIIDDEAHTRLFLRNHLEILPDVEICAEAHSVETGFKAIMQTKPDIVLLDISMQDGSGFDVLEMFTKVDFRVIFTTAHDEFALKAFRYNALDYLLKPISPKELLAAVERLNMGGQANFSEKIKNMLSDTKHKRFSNLTLSTQEGLAFVRLDEIVSLQSEGNYTTFLLANKERHVVAKSIRDFEEILPPRSFFRIHQSFMVHRLFVKKILKEEGGVVLMEGGQRIPLAQRRRQEFLAWATEDTE